jgi:hypothetical protein
MSGVRWPLLIPVVFLSFALAACGEDEATTPVACLESPAKIETALVTAPDPVQIDGTTPISECLVPDQKTGDLVNFGADAVVAATRLGERAGDPGIEGTRAAIQAGYLVGALERGAEDTGGIHTALIDRVESAATNELERAGERAQVHYDAGFEAGSKYG